MKKIKLIVVCHKNDVPEVRKVLLGTTDIEYEITFLDFSKKMKSKIEEDSLSIISDPPDFVIFFKFHTKTFMSYGKFLMESMGAKSGAAWDRRRAV